MPFRFRTCRYRETLDRRLDQSGAGPPVRIEGKHGEPVGGVNVRAGEDHGRLLVNLLNLARPPQFVQPVTKPAVKPAFNLVDGKQIELPLILAPLEPVLLVLGPQ